MTNVVANVIVAGDSCGAFLQLAPSLLSLHTRARSSGGRLSPHRIEKYKAYNDGDDDTIRIGCQHRWFGVCGFDAGSSSLAFHGSRARNNHYSYNTICRQRLGELV